MIHRNTIILLWALTMLLMVHGNRSKDHIYETITAASCFRRMNATHSTGCSSTFSGSVGVLHIIKNKADVDFLFDDGPAPPYIPVLTPSMFTRDIVMRLKTNATNRISGILLLNNRTELESFSNDLTCPNKMGSVLPNRCDSSWNRFGSGLLYEDFPFPIHLVQLDKDIKAILECFDKYNNFDLKNQNLRSLCSAELSSFMSAAVNSEVCLRRSEYVHNVNPRKYCDPLQGRNIYATLFPRPIVQPSERKVDQKEKLILLTARMDSNSMFDGVGLGARTSLASLAAVLGAAHLMGAIVNELQFENQLNVLFVIFNGEAYDYIGSQRLVYDITKGSFPTKSTYTNPINLDNIEVVLDLGSLDVTRNIGLYRFADFDQAIKLQSLFTKYANRYNLNMLTSLKNPSPNLPPTSGQSFIRENSSLPVLFFDSTRENKYYNSIYDDAENLDYTYRNTSQDFMALEVWNDSTPFEPESIQMALRNVSTTLGLALFEYVTKQEYKGEMIASSVFMDELLYCFLFSSNCRLAKALSHTNYVDYAPPRYVSVQAAYVSDATFLTYRLFGYLLGMKTTIAKKADCTPNPLMWYPGIRDDGECRLTTQNLSLAYSPAFIIKNYNLSSGRYSTWTESTWSEFNARIFLQPSLTQQSLTFAVGFVVLVISFITVFFINSKSDTLFGDYIQSSVSGAANC